MASVRVELNDAGMEELLTSSSVQAMLMQKANAVADAARRRGITLDDGESLPVEVIDAGSSTRARALIVIAHAAGLAVESKHRVLVGSLDAAG